METRINQPVGQSLLETVFALGVLITIIVATIALTTSSIASYSQSEYAGIANNLAREGVEVVRNIRDTNWLASSTIPWYQGLLTDDQTAVPVFDATNGAWVLDFSPDSITDQTAQLYQYPLIDGGAYTHTVTEQLTPYRRLIALESVCINAATGVETVTDSCVDGSTEDWVGALRIAVTVAWSERNRDHALTIHDVLYDWK